MQHKYTQVRIAASRMALPVTAAYALAVCLASSAWQGAQAGLPGWAEAACLAVTTCLMAVLADRNALIRVYSRMVPCCFLVLSVMAAPLLPSLRDNLLTACLVVFFLLYFHTYQDKRAAGRTFYAYVAWGVASVLHVGTLYLVPLLWLLQLTQLQSLSARSLCASILGLMAPYWLLGGYAASTGQLSLLAAHFATLLSIPPPLAGLQLLDVPRLATLALVALPALVGAIHFLHNSYQDKIRTRMLYETLMAVGLCSLLLLLLIPQLYNPLLRVMTVCASPLIAHFLALSRTRTSNVVLLVLTLLALLVTLYNYTVTATYGHAL